MSGSAKFKTTRQNRTPSNETLSFEAEASMTPPEGLATSYREILQSPTLAWAEQHRVIRRLGEGGQGVVYLSERVGSDHFSLPVALKIFAPDEYRDVATYEGAMARMAQMAVRIALVQQDNLIDVHNLISINGIRMLEMEWIDGYDLLRLFTRGMLERVHSRIEPSRWDYVNDVIVTEGIRQPRLKPGVAIAVIRDCLGALSALHREGIVHGDVKPSNIMLKRTGNAKLIDIGSAYEWGRGSSARTCSPAYAAPEILDGEPGSPKSDLASLGYVLVEMLTGAAPFEEVEDRAALTEAKRTFAARFPDMMPEDVRRNSLLMNLIRHLVATNPSDRFKDASAADLVEDGAASFHRQLVWGNLASDYDSDIREWLHGLE